MIRNDFVHDFKIEYRRETRVDGSTKRVWLQRSRIGKFIAISTLLPRVIE